MERNHSKQKNKIWKETVPDVIRTWEIAKAPKAGKY